MKYQSCFFAFGLFLGVFSVHAQGVSDADRSEGWVIRKTKDGIIKVPKKEVFKFDGSEVGGAAQRPSQSVLGTRPGARRSSLIPVRKSYRGEALSALGAPANHEQLYEQQR